MGRPRKDIRATIRGDCDRWAVMFAEHPGHWILSPYPGRKPEAEVLAWARRNRGTLIARTTPTIADLARGFFDPAGAWACRMREKGHHYVDKYLAVRQGHLDNYVVPLFGRLQPRELTRRMVDDAVLGATRPGGAPLSGATKNKILYSFNLLLEDAVDSGVIERNPIEGITPYSKAPTAPRAALPRDAMARLFPAGHGALVQVWGSSMWAAAMLLFQDTGMRPGELRALRWAEVYEGLRFIPIRHGIEAGTRAKVKGTKTGIMKSGYLTARTVQELAIWKAESRHAEDGDFVFTLDGEAPVTNEGIVKAFRRGLASIGEESKSWTPYYLRHSFVTYQAEVLAPEELRSLAGHTNEATNRIYQHLDDIGLYRKNLSAKRKLDKARE